MVEADGGNGAQPLPGQGRQAAPDDGVKVEPPEPDLSRINANVGPPEAPGQQQAEADKLTENGGPSGAGHPEAHAKDHDGVQNDVQHRPGGDAHHGIGGAALEPELVVEDQGGGHPGGAQQDHPKVGLGVGKDGVGGAEEVGQRREENLPQQADQRARDEGAAQPCGGHDAGLFIVLFSQLPGDIVAAAVAEEKSHGLDDGHQGENHADGSGGGVALQLSDKIGVRHVVKGSDQHTDDAGNCQAADEPLHRGLCHGNVFLFLFVHNVLFLLTFPSKNCLYLFLINTDIQ